jgi:CRP-like cAMP-binding protein
MPAMLRRRRDVDALRKVRLFSHCSPGELAGIAGIGYEKTFSAGARLIQEGQAGESLFVILDGSVEVSREGQLLEARGSADFVGEIALLSHAARTATVTAATPVRAFVIPGRAFRSLLGRQPELHVKVLEALAERAPGDDGAAGSTPASGP